MKKFWHIPWLVLSFIVSIIIIRAWEPFAGMGTVSLVVVLLGSLLVSHFISGMIGRVLLKQTWKRVFIVLLVAMLPTFVYSIFETYDVWYDRYQKVYDRFRDYLADPIPMSVSNLKFIPFEKKHETHLMFQFTISPDDLEKIIRIKGFQKIGTKSFRRPDDLFTHPEYLPLPEPAEFYIIINDVNTYPDEGIGTGYTLKVSADRHVIFRREDATYYKYQSWKNDLSRESEREFLESLRKGTNKKN